MAGARSLTASRVTLVAATLGPGGAERVLSGMANHWAAAGRSVRLITLSGIATDFYSLDPRVERLGLDLAAPSADLVGALRSNLRRVWGLRRALTAGRPSVVISFGDATNCLTLLATTGTGLRVVVSERSDPRRLPIGRSWALLRRKLYPRASAVVVQTERVAPWVREFVAKERVHVIPNFVREPAAAEGLPAKTGETRQVVAVGRLSDEKGFDLLLDAFARCAPRHPGWSLVIAGEGHQRGRLEAQIVSLGLSRQVRLLGLVRDVEGLLRASDLFVLSSRFEGFPNVLLEAMSVGLAPVAFDCDSGPGEIVRSGADGVLVPPEDAEALAVEMSRLMADDAERTRLGLGALDVRRRFGLSSILTQWERIADES